MISRTLTIVAFVCLATGVTEQLRAQSASKASRPASARSANGGIADLAPTATEMSQSGRYSTQDLENLRTQLLNLSDAVNELAALGPSNLADPDTLQQAKTQILQMPYQHLNMLRQSLSPSKLSARLTQARADIKAYTAARTASKVTSSKKAVPLFVDGTPFPSPSGFCNTIGNQINPSQSGYGSSSGSPGPGITNTGTDQSFTQDPANLRIPTAAVLAADVIRFVADTIKDFSQDACKQDVLGENISLACIVVDALAVVADAIDEGIHFCDDDLTGNVIDTSYNGLVDVHTDLNNIGTSLDTHIGTANTDIATRVAAATMTIDGNITNATNTIDTNIANLSTLLTNLINALSTQLTSATNLLAAYLQQVMKLDLTPNGQRALIDTILTCDGSAAHPCPAPLAACKASGGCSWNNVGPLP